MTSESLEQRYGRKPGGHRRVLTASVLIGLTFVTWLVWVALQHARPIANVTLISFDVRSDRAVSIRYEVGRRDAKTPLYCTLIARDFQTSIVGEVRDEIPVGGQNLVARQVTIPTRARAATAMVAHCAPISG
ncbi:MAG TPA: DUF4307 domain-containing protein [Candidatus Nanopelagicaceae bacterium]|nr:DUF4307 domain-containing protein [Candidatus Nanopelagicaceae bacterium]